IAMEQDRLDQALVIFEHLLEMHPDLAIGHLMRSIVQEARGEVAEALMDRERATELNPQLADLMIADMQGDRPTRLSPELWQAMLQELLPRAQERPPEP